ncbi:hypothetical protein RI367_003566 [Sorochytrium milnesiophthora]
MAAYLNDDDANHYDSIMYGGDADPNEQSPGSQATAADDEDAVHQHDISGGALGSSPGSEDEKFERIRELLTFQAIDYSQATATPALGQPSDQASSPQTNPTSDGSDDHSTDKAQKEESKAKADSEPASLAVNDQTQDPFDSRHQALGKRKRSNSDSDKDEEGFIAISSGSSSAASSPSPIKDEDVFAAQFDHEPHVIALSDLTTAQTPTDDAASPLDKYEHLDTAHYTIRTRYWLPSAEQAIPVRSRATAPGALQQAMHRRFDQGEGDDSSGSSPMRQGGEYLRDQNYVEDIGSDNDMVIPCQKYGHYTDECPMDVRNLAPRCSSCNLPEHRDSRRDCPRQNKTMNAEMCTACAGANHISSQLSIRVASTYNSTAAGIQQRTLEPFTPAPSVNPSSARALIKYDRSRPLDGQQGNSSSSAPPPLKRQRVSAPNTHHRFDDHDDRSRDYDRRNAYRDGDHRYNNDRGGGGGGRYGSGGRDYDRGRHRGDDHAFRPKNLPHRPSAPGLQFNGKGDGGSRAYNLRSKTPANSGKQQQQQQTPQPAPTPSNANSLFKQQLAMQQTHMAHMAAYAQGMHGLTPKQQ